MRNNICLDTDSYKQSHFLQYPHGEVLAEESLFDIRKRAEESLISQTKPVG